MTFYIIGCLVNLAFVIYTFWEFGEYRWSDIIPTIICVAGSWFVPIAFLIDYAAQKLIPNKAIWKR